MSGRLVRLVCVAATAATTVLAPAPATAVPEPGPAQDPASAQDAASVAGLLTDLQQHYRKAEEATEAYNATEEKLKNSAPRPTASTALWPAPGSPCTTAGARRAAWPGSSTRAAPTSPRTYACSWPATRSTRSTRAM
ncbi:hypothetical protein SVIOM74S_06887 [Streptomyces violarus]